MSSQVEQIKERLSIADVVGTYIKLEKAGTNYKARCPFHHEKTPSFFVSAGRNSYYCFGCGAKGDIFTFVQEFEGVDFLGALKVLAERAGIELKREDPKMRTERERLYLCLESATIFFQKNLYTKSEHKDKVDYLLGRGLTKETIKEWRIGFAEDDWRTLLEYLKERKFTLSDMEKVGLIKRKDGTERKANPTSEDFYDRFRGRIMFPLFDSSGRVIGFSGRIFKGDEKSAKYLNSPETELFNKSQMLYGMQKAKTAIRESDGLILVEGQMDMLMSQQAGFRNTVAVSGTALTPQHLEMVRRLTNKLTMAFDPDSAGIAAAERSARIALSIGMEVRVARLPKGEDPALLILNRPDDWKQILSSSTHIIEFMVNHIQSSALDERAKAKEIIKRALPFVASLDSSMEQSHFVNMIHRKTGIKEDAIWDDLKKVTPAVTEEKQEETQREKNTVQLSRKNSIERKIIGIVLWQETKSAPVLDTKHIKQRLAEIIGSTHAETLSEHEKHKDELILEAELSYDKSTKLKQETEELLIYLEEDYLKEAFAKALEEMSKAERDKDSQKAQTLLARCKELSEKLSSLPKIK